MKTWLEKTLVQVPGGSTLAQVIRYGLSRWDGFTVPRRRPRRNRQQHRRAQHETDCSDEVFVERVEKAEPDRLYPRFLGGERRCPPEDCGSVPGYYEFIDTIAGPDKGKGSRRKKEALDWYGGPYDPNDIGEEEILAALNRIAARSRRQSRRANPT